MDKIKLEHIKYMKYSLASVVTAFLMTLFAGTSSALAGQPEPWQLGMQEPASPVMEKLVAFHNGPLLWMCIIISVFVLVLLAYVVVKYNRKANPVPSKTSHNTALEVVWTLVPVLILLVIAVPSLLILTYTKKIPEPDMTVKIVGNQWNWTYSYPEHGDIEFISIKKQEEELKDGEPYLLAVDNNLVLPVGKNIRFLITGSDVIHSWAVPALGVKMDGVPGRVNETWTHINREGIYYGQCSELCGKDHGFMPIAVEAGSQEQFDSWVAKKIAEG
ncbi:MAG: cytochrome c oxidase subunit II [Rickettsiales bacterium]|nr:cytochrome c oxidase subunit II [Rickettsiales bacterium]